MTDPTGGPAIPDTHAPDNDVNPICGHHRRAKCLGCGSCATCDACYCGEDGEPLSHASASDTWSGEERDFHTNPFDY
ncbi:hypothetical protein B4N89_13540 [Embleya scabrispora]|uniref:Uncharacterized protein n=1 Tax=Embleya scabrispora TaxID=159449 RepID=A0A1T3NYA9_9ACTN|nr:hypothetical protein [Embleya scabrispora]OPC81823.1 hypothetical protein B4N89_13540 [Embleya scabrispora]